MYNKYIYDEEEYPSSIYCEEIQRLDDAGEWFEEISDLLYGKKEFNLIEFEKALEKLGEHLKRRLPENKLSIFGVL